MAHEQLLVKPEGPITTITLNRPEVMNALHRPAHFELGEVFDGFAGDPELWIAIVTGAGDKAFSAGNDLKYHAELRAKTGEPGAPPSPRRIPRRRVVGGQRRRGVTLDIPTCRVPQQVLVSRPSRQLRHRHWDEST